MYWECSILHKWTLFKPMSTGVVFWFQPKIPPVQRWSPLCTTLPESFSCSNRGMAKEVCPTETSVFLCILAMGLSGILFLSWAIGLYLPNSALFSCPSLSAGRKSFEDRCLLCPFALLGPVWQGPHAQVLLYSDQALDWRGQKTKLLRYKL